MTRDNIVINAVEIDTPGAQRVARRGRNKAREDKKNMGRRLTLKKGPLIRIL